MAQALFRQKGHIIDVVDASSFAISGWKVSTFLAVLFLALMPWLKMHDLLQTPSEVALAREKSAELIASYQLKKTLWDEQCAHLLQTVERQQRELDISQAPFSFERLPLELALSLFQPLFQSSFSCYPLVNEEGQFLLISKEQEGIWPLKITLSLELQITPEPFKVEAVRLRRGQREIPLPLASHYFAKEMAFLQSKQDFLSGLQAFSFYLAPLKEGSRTEEFKMKGAYRRQTHLITNHLL